MPTLFLNTTHTHHPRPTIFLSWRAIPPHSTLILRTSFCFPDSAYGNDNPSFLEDSETPREITLTDEQLEELTDLFFPPNLISNAEPNQHWQYTSLPPAVAASVDSIWRAPEINLSPIDALRESSPDFGLEDRMPVNFPIADAVQTQSQGLPTSEELMSPGASALRESNGSGKKPRYRSFFLEFYSNFLENQRNK